MKLNKLFALLLTSVMLSSCGGAKEAAKVALQEADPVPEEVLEPDTTVYDKNEAVDLRQPQFRSPEDEEEEEESYVVDKVILHYYNEDAKCALPGTAGRAFYVWYQGSETGYEYSDESNYSADRFTYAVPEGDAAGTMMTLTIDMINDPMFQDFYGTKSIMYIIKYKMESEANLNWGGQSEDVELKFSEFTPNKDRVVEVWCTPAAGGGIAQFDSAEKTKVEGVKLAKFSDWKTIACTTTNNVSNVTWRLYAFDETYFKVKAKNRAGIKKNYLIKEGTTTSKSFNITFQYNVHINAVYAVDSFDINGTEVNGEKLIKTAYVSFEDLYGTARFEKYYNYDGDDLGVTYTPTETTFKVWSPVAANVSLYLYNTDTSAAYDGSDKYKGWHMNYQPGGIWTLTVKGDLANDPAGYKYFNYYVDTWSTSGVCMDPYATGCGANGLRGLVYDKSLTNPAGWDTLETHLTDITTPQQLTIYEVHIEDFTGDASWGGPEEERGTYNGFVRSNTRLPSDNTITTGFDHLKELGIGAVQFVPVFDSDNDEVKNTKYNWGYNPLNYNCVEGAYSSDPHDGTVRIREFKNMINELAKEDMRTIMDVVYNHVSSPTASCFNKLMPRYYFRYSKAGDVEVDVKHWCEPGELYDGSGCHNEFKSEATMARKFIVDSVCMWAREYKVKGFRFDLMALIDGYTMKDIKKALYQIDPDIYIYGEGWTADRYHGKKTWYDTNNDGVKEYVDSFGSFAVPGYDDTGLNTTSGYQVYSELYNEESDQAIWLGAFDGSGRDALRGDNNPGYGFINKGKEHLGSGNAAELQHVIWGERADGQGGNPKQTIEYASCHDNYTLRDQLYATLGDGTNSPYLIDVLHGMMATQTMVFASNAAAFMLGGEEIMRTKEVIFDEAHPEALTNNVTADEFAKIPITTYHTHYGHKLSHNSYNSPLKVNSFKWGNKVSITGDHSDTIDMKAENLTAKYAALIALHKEMPKRNLSQLSAIGPGHNTTNGYAIDSVYWGGSVSWNDYGTIGIQYDDWFVFVTCRQWGYLKNDVSGWTQKYTAGVVVHDTMNVSINLGDEGTGIGLAAAVYYRGTHA